MDFNCLDKILTDEPKYRLEQIKEAIFKNLIENWSDAVNLSLQLRDRLNKECPLEISGKIFS